MSMFAVRVTALAAVSFFMLPAGATEVWHPAPGEAGFTYHPDHLRSTMTRDEFLARWEDERRQMLARGYRWDQLYGTYVLVGPGAAPTSTLTREQFLATQAEQDRQMAIKGMRWNQLFGTWQSSR